jgi:hypothetical protein
MGHGIRTPPGVALAAPIPRIEQKEPASQGRWADAVACTAMRSVDLPSPISPESAAARAAAVGNLATFSARASLSVSHSARRRGWPSSATALLFALSPSSAAFTSKE